MMREFLFGFISIAFGASSFLGFAVFFFALAANEQLIAFGGLLWCIVALLVSAWFAQEST